MISPIKYDCTIQITKVKKISFEASDMDEATEIAQRLAEEIKANELAAGSTTTDIHLTDEN